MKKLFLVGFLLVSSLTFAHDGLRLDSGHVSLSFGDRRDTGVVLVLNASSGSRYHYTDRYYDRYSHRYEHRDNYRYDRNYSRYHRHEPQRVMVVNRYETSKYHMPYGQSKKFNPNNKKWDGHKYERNRLK